MQRKGKTYQRKGRNPNLEKRRDAGVEESHPKRGRKGLGEREKDLVRGDDPYLKDKVKFPFKEKGTSLFSGKEKIR